MNALLQLRSNITTAYALGLLLLGALAFAAFRFNVPAEAPVLGFLLFGWLGVALGRLTVSPAPAAAAANSEPSRAKTDAVDNVLRSIARLVQSHLSDSEAFSERLTGASVRLSQHTSTGPIKEIVMALIEDNREMRGKLSHMRNQLEESRLRVLQLQNNLERSEEASMRDMVTMIGNRRFFETALAEEIGRARRTGGNLCLALGDLDRFKLVNDRFGHLVGDRLLRLFAEILVQNVRGQDKVARFGGEEFVVLLPGADVNEALQAVERIRRTLESKQWTLEPSGERVGRVTVSFGLGKLRPEETGAELLRRVDNHLYEAKARGRNCTVADEGEPQQAADPQRARSAADG